MEDKILETLARLCPDFAPYSFLKEDLYKGSLFDGYNVYFKEGIDGSKGLITGKRNIKKYNLDRFPTNFTAIGTRDGSRVEQGWRDEALIEVLEHLSGFNQ